MSKLWNLGGQTKRKKERSGRMAHTKPLQVKNKGKLKGAESMRTENKEFCLVVL